PTTPASLRTTATAPTQVDLGWTASTDNIGVTQYFIRRNGVVIGNATGTTYQDKTVIPSTTYQYVVVASDAAGNASAVSNQISVTTPALPDTTPPTQPTNLVATAA